MKRIKRLLLSLTIAGIMLLSLVVPVAAATTAEITVTATPTFLAIAITQNTWTINGIDGDSKIDLDTTYYSNETGASGDITAPSATVEATECYFTITNTSNVVTDQTANMVHFTGGDAMQNTDTGYATNAAGSFGASTYTTGAAWTGGAVILKNAGSSAMITSLAATTDQKFGVAIKSQSGAWTSASAMTSTITVTATES